MVSIKKPDIKEVINFPAEKIIFNYKITASITLSPGQINQLEKECPAESYCDHILLETDTKSKMFQKRQLVDNNNHHIYYNIHRLQAAEDIEIFILHHNISVPRLYEIPHEQDQLTKRKFWKGRHQEGTGTGLKLNQRNSPRTKKKPRNIFRNPSISSDDNDWAHVAMSRNHHSDSKKRSVCCAWN